MLLFLDRSHRAADPWLTWKVRFFQVGAVLAVVGMVTERNWVVGAATVILAVGFSLRFVPHPSRKEDPTEVEESA